MLAYLGLHHGTLQGVILTLIALLVIVIGVIGYRWVARAESVHIVRDEDDPGADGPDRR